MKEAFNSRVIGESMKLETSTDVHACMHGLVRVCWGGGKVVGTRCWFDIGIGEKEGKQKSVKQLSHIQISSGIKYLNE